MFRAILGIVALSSLLSLGRAVERPNIVFILTDDQRYDALGVFESPWVKTPNLDRLAKRGVRFANAFVTLSICSPSRAAVLTGQYGSVNGVVQLDQRVRDASPQLAKLLAQAGYRTGHFGKWHLANEPRELGFATSAYFVSNGKYYDRRAIIEGQEQVVPGYIDDAMAQRTIDFMQQAQAAGKPFLAWYCPQAPHADPAFDWPARDEFLNQYTAAEMPLTANWNDDLAGKPPYLATARHRTQALTYGYDDPAKIRRHRQRYAAAVTQMDAAIGKIVGAVERLGIQDNTWFVVMGDNGWLLGEHGCTSKVLAYEPSIRVPLLITGPGQQPAVKEQLALNIDLPATILDLARVGIPEAMQGRSLLPLLKGEKTDWRKEFVYEAPAAVLGAQPLWAVRNDRWKLIRTYTAQAGENMAYDELYDLAHDPEEMYNLAKDPQHAATLRALESRLEQHRRNAPMPVRRSQE